MTRKYGRYRGSRKGPMTVLLLLALTLALLIPAAAVHLAEQKKTGAAKTEDTAEKGTQKKPDASAAKSSDKSESETETSAAADSPAAAPVTGPAEVAAPQVDGTYFSDAVFIGDSRTEGLQLYSGLKNGRFLCAKGATVASIYDKSRTEAGTPIMTALNGLQFSKVYIMLGINELGWVYTKTFTDQYAKVIDSIRAKNPEAQIALQSILPVSAAQEAKHGYINNERIKTYNELIQKLAADKKCTYLNVAEAVTASDGCLADSLSADGLHLNVDGCKRWLQYLEAYPLT